MTESQRVWAEARDRLKAAVSSLGYPGELADMLSKQLKSPRAIDRMTSYVRNVRPRSMEMIVDEMLAICADVDTWHRKKESETAQAGYNAWLNSEMRLSNLDEDD
ncbi:MAG: hypothetical protein IJ719_15995 [Clostridia bacterium]|nr:hypothetical protein [Clostridia bacterium]